MGDVRGKNPGPAGGEAREGALRNDASRGGVTQLLRAYRETGVEKRRALINELFTRLRRQLEERARVLLRRFPGVLRHEEEGDILSRTWIALERHLLTCNPENTREFLGLANRKMLQLLLSLAEKYRSPKYARVWTASDNLDHSESVSTRIFGGTLGPATWVMETEQVGLLWRCIDALSADDRELILCRYFQEMPIPEVAEVLGVSEKTVDRRLADVRKKLARLMSEEVQREERADG